MCISMHYCYATIGMRSLKSKINQAKSKSSITKSTVDIGNTGEEQLLLQPLRLQMLRYNIFLPYTDSNIQASEAADTER